MSVGVTLLLAMTGVGAVIGPVVFNKSVAPVPDSLEEVLEERTKRRDLQTLLQFQSHI